MSKKSNRVKLNVVKLHTQPTDSPPSKKFKPLTAFAQPIWNNDTSSRGDRARKDPKGKSKDVSDHQNSDDRLWIEMYEPTTEADLAVHKKKVENVRRWFLDAFDGGPSGKLKMYRRILALTGPAGTGKTTTVRILARELGFEILEWKNPMEAGFPSNGFSGFADDETSFEKFQAFLARASTCQNLFTQEASSSHSAGTSRLFSQPSPKVPEGPPRESDLVHPSQTKRKIILLEDLPNILHAGTQQKFHAALESFVASSDPGAAPVVVIISDAGLRGEDDNERIQTGGSWGRDVVDIRTVLPPSLLGSAYATQISFNPIAPTFLRKALQSLLDAHFSRSSSRKVAATPSKEVLDTIVESANGDIRSAIMGLQFACLVELPRDRRGKTRSLGVSRRSKVVLEAVTRREQTLALFHLLGKVLYNKRKGDPPNASATAKEVQRQKDLDSRLRDPPSHPFLKNHDRRASRVDVDTLYADSPIDSSLFSLYIHQNYTQFCNEVEECDGVAEWLSWIDSSGGEAWYQANPHRFHLLTLGTLHSLPSPVLRRAQKKFLKPEFFQSRAKERDAWGAVGDVRRWINGEYGTLEPPKSEEPGSGIGGWSLVDIATELGGVLKARDNAGMASCPPPPQHRLFSRLAFTKNEESGRGQELREDDSGDDSFREHVHDEEESWGRPLEDKERTIGGWLESDDIEES